LQRGIPPLTLFDDLPDLHSKNGALCCKANEVRINVFVQDCCFCSLHTSYYALQLLTIVIPTHVMAADALMEQTAILAFAQLVILETIVAQVSSPVNILFVRFQQ